MSLRRPARPCRKPLSPASSAWGRRLGAGATTRTITKPCSSGATIRTSREGSFSSSAARASSSWRAVMATISSSPRTAARSVTAKNTPPVSLVKGEGERERACAGLSPASGRCADRRRRWPPRRRGRGWAAMCSRRPAALTIWALSGGQGRLNLGEGILLGQVGAGQDGRDMHSHGDHEAGEGGDDETAESSHAPHSSALDDGKSLSSRLAARGARRIVEAQRDREGAPRGKLEPVARLHGRGTGRWRSGPACREALPPR